MTKATIAKAVALAVALASVPASLAQAPAYDMVEPETLVKMLEDQMREAATALDFEAAARLRDQLFEVKARMPGGAAREKVAADVKAGGRR